MATRDGQGSGEGGLGHGERDDDGLDQLRRDLVDLVLREAGGRVAADANSPVAKLLTGIVRREMATAVDILRRDEAGRGAPTVSERGGLDGGHAFRPSTAVQGRPDRMRDAVLVGVGALAALLLFGAGFATAGWLAKSATPQSAVVSAPAVVDPADSVVTGTPLGPVAPAVTGPSGSVDGTTGMATQLRERPQ